jgi:3-oxoacyl-[acyl-carrier-protein] synthase II
MQFDDVVISGIGVVAGQDCGRDALVETLRGAEMKSSVVDDTLGFRVPGSARRAVLTKGADLSPWLSPAAARRMSPPSRFAVAAAQMAMVSAGLAGDDGGAGTGVVLSSAFGPATSTEQLLATARRDGPQAVSPFAFAESVANAAAGQVAIFTKSHGPNLTVVQREAGALTAVGRGAELIASGRADRVLVGAVDEMPEILHALIGRFDALVRPDADGREVARPFDARRNGFVAAEGAAVLVLERAAAARARGIAPVARIRGFGGAFDATAPRIGWGRGHDALARALTRTCSRAGIAISDITRIVSGACGSIAGDRLEAHVLRTAWGQLPIPVVLAPKGHLGQYGGGFLAAAALSVAGGRFGPTPGFACVDPELGVRPFGGGELPPAALTLFTTIGSGGSASWLLAEAV